MESSAKKIITVEAEINASIEKVWDFLTNPEHIVRWNNASDDWHTTHAENDLRTGGRFLSRMEARDGSNGFDFTGIYTDVMQLKRIDYTLDGGRTLLEIDLDVNPGYWDYFAETWPKSLEMLKSICEK